MSGKLQGKHVLFMLLGFFGVMITVNMIFVYFALTSFSGLSVQDSYQRGLNYNKVIEEQEKLDSRSWQTPVLFEQLGSRRGSFFLKVTDSDGKKVSIDGAVATLRRPVGQYDDRSQRMVTTRDGLETVFEFESEGQWDIIINISGGGYEQPYRVEKRIWVK